MAEQTTIARPYANGAFRFAKEAKALSQWEKMLAVAAAVASDADVQAYLQRPELKAEQKADAFVKVCGEDLLNEAGRNFVTLLALNDRLALLPAIFRLFHELLAQEEAFVDAELVSAHELDESEVNRLVDALKKRLGREVRAQTRVDANLIGGVVIRAGDTVIDGSVRGRLVRLAEQLNS